MPLVFLSHSSDDNAQALALAQWLEKNGWIDYFLDVSETRGLSPGERWQQALKDASHRCEAVIFLVSSTWLDSKWCLAEFLLAKQLGKKIFGVLIDDIPIAELPHELTGEWQLCDLVKGDTYATFDVERKPFVTLCHVQLAEVGLMALKRGLRNAGLEATAFPWPPRNEPTRAPYRGLKPYEAQDAAVFFGRDAAIVRGLDQIRRLRDSSNDSMLVILGSSGAGKSSFLRAGLWPRLKRDDHHFYTLPIVRPRGAAVNGEEGLVNSLFTALTDTGIKTISRGDIRRQFKDEHGAHVLKGFLEQLRHAIVARAITETPEPTFILPVDQGEELYNHNGAEEARQMRRQLSFLQRPDGDRSEALQSPKLLVVVTIRTDLYERLQTDELMQDVGRDILDITPMDRAEYKRIIEGPAQRATEAGNALTIEPELTEALLGDTHGADALPMLAFTLERLYIDSGADGNLTFAEYQLLGGVTGCLTAAIDAAMISPRDEPVIPVDKVAQQTLLRKAFIPWLAEVDEQTGERRRRVAHWDELPSVVKPALERLTRARLLVRDFRSIADGIEDRRVVVEIAHEALLRRWPALVSWLDADQDSLQTLGTVSRAAQHWKQSNQDDDLLVHKGERLLDAEKLIDREDFKKRLQATGFNYLARCRAYEREQTEKERKHKQHLTVALAVAVVLAIVTSVAAWRAYVSGRAAQEATVAAEKNAAEAKLAEKKAVAEKERAQRERDGALRAQSLYLADQSRQEAQLGRSTAAILLALEALPKTFDPPDRPLVKEAEAALYNAVATHHEIHIFHSEESIGFLNGVQHATFSGDGQRIASAASDKTARLWDAASGAALAVLSHTDQVNFVAFSPDGKHVVTASDDTAAIIWDVATGERLHVLGGHQGIVGEAKFSPDGRSVLTAEHSYIGTGNTVRIWDARNGEQRLQFSGVAPASFSPDGRRILTGTRTYDKRSALRDAKTGELIGEIPGSAVFGPHCGRIVSLTSEGKGYLWDEATGTANAVWMAPAVPREDAVPVISPDGTRLAFPTNERTALILDADTGIVQAELEGHSEMITTLNFSSDGSRIVSASVDMYARVWDAATGDELARLGGHQNMILSAAFSPDGQRVVTASLDHTARVWQTDLGLRAQVLGDHRDRILDIALSSDGRRLATASADRTARIWDMGTGEQVAVLQGHKGPIHTVRFSPNGQCVLTESADKGVCLWDANDGRLIAQLQWTENLIGGGVISPDGRYAVTYGDNFFLHDCALRVWDSRTGEILKVLTGHDAGVIDAKITADCKRIISSSYDGTVRLWNRQSGETIAVLKGESGRLWASQLSPNGLCFTTHDDRASHLRSAETGAIIAHLPGLEWSDTSSFSPSGRNIVSKGMDHVWLYDTASGKRIRRLKNAGADLPFSWSRWVWSPDDRFILGIANVPDYSGVSDTVPFVIFDPKTQREWPTLNKGYLWNTDTGKLVSILKGAEKSIAAAAFQGDNRFVYGNSLAKDLVMRWRVDSGELVSTRRLSGEILDAFLGTDELKVLAADDNGMARVVNLETEEPVCTLAKRITRASFSDDGAYIVANGAANRAHLFDAETGLEVIVTEEKMDTFGFSFSRDGKRLFVLDHEGSAQILSIGNGITPVVIGGEKVDVRYKWDTQQDRLEKLPGFVEDDLIADSPDGRRQVRRRDAAHGTLLDSTTEEVIAEIDLWPNEKTRVSFSRNGKWLYSVHDKVVRVWSAETGDMTTLKGHTSSINSVTFSEKIPRIITTSGGLFDFDQTARLWRADSGEALAVWQGKNIRVAAISPDGRLIAMVSEDGDARIYDAETGLELATLAAPGFVTHARFGHDGERLVTASDDASVRIWRIPPTGEKLNRYARSILPRGLSSAERERFFIVDGDV